jgi:hypothetical protein
MRRIADIRALGLSLLMAALLGVGLSGCQKLFTTSIASSLARDTLSIPSNLSASDASDLAAQAKANNDTKLASALVESLVSQIASTSDSSAKTELQAAAVTAAIIASGTSSALTDVITDYEKDGSTPDAEALKSLLTTIQEGAAGTGVVDALLYLNSSTGLSTDAAKDAGIGATDYAIAAVVIAASVIPAGSDPSTFDYSTLSTEDQATIDVAKTMILNASALVEAGSSAADLLKTISDQFQLPTT